MNDKPVVLYLCNGRRCEEEFRVFHTSCEPCRHTVSREYSLNNWDHTPTAEELKERFELQVVDGTGFWVEREVTNA